MQLFSIIAQFGLDILLIPYWKLLWACPDGSDHTYMNEVNQKDLSMDA